MRRLTFACELLSNPSVLFCDEPTTGLDSFMAESVVQVLSNLAKSGRTVICTIHQPSSQLYLMFDRVMFMAGGKTAFLGAPRDAIQVRKLPFFQISKILYSAKKKYLFKKNYFFSIVSWLKKKLTYKFLVFPPSLIISNSSSSSKTPVSRVHATSIQPTWSSTRWPWCRMKRKSVGRESKWFVPNLRAG